MTAWSNPRSGEYLTKSLQPLLSLNISTDCPDIQLESTPSGSIFPLFSATDISNLPHLLKGSLYSYFTDSPLIFFFFLLDSCSLKLLTNTTLTFLYRVVQCLRYIWKGKYTRTSIVEIQSLHDVREITFEGILIQLLKASDTTKCLELGVFFISPNCSKPHIMAISYHKATFLCIAFHSSDLICLRDTFTLAFPSHLFSALPHSTTTPLEPRENT